MQDLLAEHDWTFLKTVGPHEGAGRMTEIITGYAEECIGKKVFHEREATHPWLNAITDAAMQTRNAAAGCPDERQAMQDCIDVMKRDREK